MSTYVLGTHTSHNCSACLLKDGKIEVAIEKERITRIKHAGGNDNLVVRYCLDAAGISLDDVDVVVQTANFDMFERIHCGSRVAGRTVENARQLVTISHHLAHMLSAVATAPFTDMAVLVIDGCGNCYADCIDKKHCFIPEIPPTAEAAQLYFEKDSYYEYSAESWRSVYKDFSLLGRQQRYPMFPFTMHSIGGLYAAVSQYIFRGMDDPGKVMGLAPYGRPHMFGDEIFILKDGRVFVNYEWTNKFDRPAEDYNDFKQNFQYYADIAWWVQREVERAILYVVDKRYEMCPKENLAYAGGVALNAVANHLIKTKLRFKNVYIQPAAGDNGLAIGCAFYGWSQVLRQKRPFHGGSTYFGRCYGRDEIERSLAQEGLPIKYEHQNDVVSVAADLLASGMTIGWFEGQSEFGPRALGHRSILALPTNAAIKDHINSKVKFREDFRPFAPSVIAEDVSDYFEQHYDSPYMILISYVRDEWRERLPAVVHRDGTARVQTVHKNNSTRYHELHVALKKRTGISVLLNTSLNKRGTPIVETPAEAIALFLETALDALIIENWLVTKIQNPSCGVKKLDLTLLFQRISQAASRDRIARSLGVLELTVTGTEEVWTLDLGERPRILRGSAPSADHVAIVTTRAIRQLIQNPSDAHQLYDSGEVQIPGVSARDPNAVASVLHQLNYFISLARTCL
jgi:carbamoyltransferase